MRNLIKINGVFSSKELHPIFECILDIQAQKLKQKEKWDSIHNQLVDVSLKTGYESDRNVIIEVLTYLSDFSDEKCMDIIIGLMEMNFGCNSSFWFSSCALVSERNQKYIQSLYFHEKSLTIDDDFNEFAKISYESFKGRLKDTIMQSNRAFLGEFNGNQYEYHDGLICTDINGRPAIPDFDIFEILGIEKPRIKKNNQERVPLQEKKDIKPSKVSPIPLPTFDDTEIDIKPKSILKKSKPSFNANSNHVRIDIQDDHDQFKPKRIPTPTTKQKLSMGSNILIDGTSYDVIQILGDSSFLCESSKGSRFVFKASPSMKVMVRPSIYLLTNDESITGYYVTPYILEGTFDRIIEILHKKPRIDENVVHFYLLQFIRIINALESQNLYHNEISTQSLIIRTPGSEELPPFDDGKIWNKTGLTLCRCDKISEYQSSGDREAFGAIFYLMALRDSHPEKNPPNRWNQNIWKSAYSVFYENEDTKYLESQLVESLKKNGNSIRSSIARIQISLVENT